MVVPLIPVSIEREPGTDFDPDEHRGNEGNQGHIFYTSEGPFDELVREFFNELFDDREFPTFSLHDVLIRDVAEMHELDLEIGTLWVPIWNPLSLHRNPFLVAIERGYMDTKPNDLSELNRSSLISSPRDFRVFHKEHVSLLHNQSSLLYAMRLRCSPSHFRQALS